MKLARVVRYLPLLWASLRRRRVRTTFTIGSIFIASAKYLMDCP